MSIEDNTSLAAQALSWQEIVTAAAHINVEPCTLQAVCTVESSGGGFLSSGRPKILFEGHIFWRELTKRHYQPEILAADFPSIIYQKWTKQHYQGGEKEYERLAIAQSIHHEAAYCSTSWGAFQIMGFHHALCGFHTVDDFVATQHHSCHKQLDAFCQFLVANKLQIYLQNRDWEAFARRYNGPEYLRNQYDKKLEIAYRACQNAHS